MNDLNAAERQLAINEVRVLSILDNQNIVSYYDSFESNGNIYIEMEYADAGTLAEFLSQLSAPLQEYEILLIFRQIVSAVSYMHENNILHRDIKTANIFLNKEGYIKVGDFGISKLLTTRRVAESVVGTPYYISPEICQSKPYTKSSDIWSLGCVLYELAMRHKTFEGSNLPGQFPPVKHNYSDEFRNLINELLNRNPDLRPTAQEVMDSLVRLLNKQQLDRIQMWSQYQEMPTSVMTSGIIIQNSSSVRYPRSAVYEVQIREPHIKLSSVLLPPKIRIKELSKSSTHFLALSYNSVVYSWGTGSKGQLGLGESVLNSAEPTRIHSISNRNIVRICASDGFSLFVSKNGLVMTCGDHESGCLGRIDTIPCFTPKLVDTLLSADVSCIGCGPNHVSVVTGDGKAYSWGSNIDGRLGIDSHMTSVELPTSVVFPDEVIIKNVFCGHDCTAFIDDNGFVWICGNNYSNKLGLNEKLQFRTIKVNTKWIPTKLKWIKHRVLSVSLGVNHSAFVIEDGKLITCGVNCDGQLGLGHVRSKSKLNFVKQMSEQKIIRVQTGLTFTVASNCENVIYFWGGRPLNSVSSDGKCNQSLMNVVESVGPDHPIVQIRDPQIIIDNLSDLSLLSSTNKAIILKPQPIVSLYASPVHLHQGDAVGLANLYVFPDDSVYIVIDTTIPLNTENTDLSQQTLSLSTVPEEEDTLVKASVYSNNSDTNLSQNIPEWIRKEMEENNSAIDLDSRLNSMPIMLESMNTNSDCCECRQEINALRNELQQKDNIISTLQSLNRELDEQNIRLKRREQELNKKFSLCKQCSIIYVQLNKDFIRLSEKSFELIFSLEYTNKKC
ncbi:unnamed protein product [Medioppia subpectinata]|uniref:non-specific serine/threonine protein kinase n=1 Tax=Medioppia subpectinata TaxID=1979941 RepID=A0A7R9PY27_9ACAR|nr:unnamed protein product [Medioppia subpectinata]CAG2104632.1 unnamed protein product [Medioppia subpectinata]